MVKMKNQPSKENDLKSIKNELKEYQGKAQIYLEILKRLEERTPRRGLLDLPAFMTGESMKLTKDEFEFIEANSAILQEQCNKFGLGVGSLKEAFGMEYHPRFEFIVNFPVRYKNPIMRDDALVFLSYVKTALSTYIQKVKEMLNNKNKLSDYIQEKVISIKKIPLKTSSNPIENKDIIRKQVATRYTIMDDYIISELENDFNRLKLPPKFYEDFFRVLNFFGKKIVYNDNHKEFIQDSVEEWYAKNKDRSRKEMETKCFHPFMREKLKDEFGEEIVDTPDEARGHIDLKLSFTIPIELKVLKDNKGRKRDDKRNALDLLENQFTTQIKSEIINSRVGFLVGLDFRQKIDRDLTVMPHPEYMRFKWISYPQSTGLIIILVFLANKKASSK